MAALYSRDEDILYEPYYKGQTLIIGDYPNGPVEKIRELVTREQNTAPIFSELFSLGPNVNDSDDAVAASELCWYEVARWIKFEETVEEGGKRWSKPHISLLTFSSLLQLRNCFKKGNILLDKDFRDFIALAGSVIDTWNEQNSPQLDMTEIVAIEDALLSSKCHLQKTPIGGKYFIIADGSTAGSLPARGSSTHLLARASESDLPDLNASHTPAAEAETEMTLVPPVAIVEHAKRHEKMPAGSNVLKKLSAGSEVATIFVGHVQQLTRPLCAFVRLKQAKQFGGISEAALPLRFVFVLLVPTDHTEASELEAIGRSLGTLMVDETFAEVAYKALEPIEFCYAIDEFLSNMLIIPAGKWSPSVRLEPSDTKLPSRAPAVTKGSLKKRSFSIARRPHALEPGLRRTGQLFGGLVMDVRRKVPFYLSDFRDAFCSVSAITQCLAAALFLFFANITNIITFGGVIETLLDKQMGTIENLLSGALSGIIFALFAGQPLNILSATGPMLVFEAILYKFCLDQSWNFLAFRFWVGTWASVILIIMVATDASFVVALITKFSEESFASLISIVFIIEAFQQLFKIASFAPITTDPIAVLNDPCVCENTTTFWTVDQNESSIIEKSFLNATSAEDCSKLGGKAVGEQCHFSPDVFLFSTILFVGAFVIAFGLKLFRNTGFLPTTARRVLADFSVLIAIVLMTAMSLAVGVQTPKLNVPTSIVPTTPRSWLVNPLQDIEWFVILAAIIPAIFFTILVFMDQQITCVIINRKENKLKKGYGYHLDLFVLSICIFLCSLIALPYYVAATVISIMHVDALKVTAENTAPGEPQAFLGVREQRITAILANLLIACAVFITPVIRLVPLPVLLGLFLYMGVVSLAGLQFTQRLLLILVPQKYQPDVLYLRQVPLKRVHLYTAIQVAGLALLYTIKSIKMISMLFPVMLVVIVGIRAMLEKCFTAPELAALDHKLPSWQELIRTSKGRKLSDGVEFRRTTIRRA